MGVFLAPRVFYVLEFFPGTVFMGSLVGAPREGLVFDGVLFFLFFMILCGLDQDLPLRPSHRHSIDTSLWPDCEMTWRVTLWHHKGHNPDQGRKMD